MLEKAGFLFLRTLLVGAKRKAPSKYNVQKPRYKSPMFVHGGNLEILSARVRTIKRSYDQFRIIFIYQGPCV